MPGREFFAAARFCTGGPCDQRPGAEADGESAAVRVAVPARSLLVLKGAASALDETDCLTISLEVQPLINDLKRPPI